MQKVIFIFILAIFFSGCAPFKNLRVEDVRRDENLARSGSFEMTLDKVVYCLDKTIYNCGQGNRIVVDPDNKKRGTLFIFGMGLTQSNPYVIIDFTEDEQITTYKGYRGLSTWGDFIDTYIDMIKMCGVCK